jgi:dihydroorotase
VDLPTTMSRYLALGSSLAEVITATTTTPAAILGRPDLGALRVGAPADISVLRLDDTPVELPDAEGVRRTVPVSLRPVLTIVGGTVHRADEVRVPLRPLLGADLEVDCSTPVEASSGAVA